MLYCNILSDVKIQRKSFYYISFAHVKKKSKSVTIVYKRSMSSTIYNVNFRTYKNYFAFLFADTFL